MAAFERLALSLARRGALPILAVALLCVSPAMGQGRGGGPGGGGPGGGGMAHGPFGAGSSFPNNRTSSMPGSASGSGSTETTIHSGLQLGPPGRWWDDHQFARSIGLDNLQQQRMDDVFGANKGALLKLYKNLQHEESQLEKVTHVRNLNEAQIFDQIDRVVQARGELEKANAHYLLQIRKEMTPEQAARLEDLRSTP